MMKQIPLVIIDVQNGFTILNRERLALKVVKHIKLAKKREAPIVVLEYEGFQRTHSLILSELEGYRNYVVLKKSESDGSYKTESILVEKWGLYAPLDIKVCGVYLTACVNSTVLGLMRKGFTVSVIAEACDNDGKDWQVENWMKHNIKVVYNR